MYVSDAMVKRLPAYYRHLKELERESVRQISSKELGQRMGLTASQIRQDITASAAMGGRGTATPSAACGNISVIFWGWIRPIR